MRLLVGGPLEPPYRTYILPVVPEAPSSLLGETHGAIALVLWFFGALRYLAVQEEVLKADRSVQNSLCALIVASITGVLSHYIHEGIVVRINGSKFSFMFLLLQPEVLSMDSRNIYSHNT